jgi:hypothetical protein
MPGLLLFAAAAQTLPGPVSVARRPGERRGSRNVVTTFSANGLGGTATEVSPDSKSTTTIRRELPFLDRSVYNESGWLSELLLLWRPAGTSSGNLGLPLAIRNGYFNLYCKGQSVAHARMHIDFSSDSMPAGHRQWKMWQR